MGLKKVLDVKVFKYGTKAESAKHRREMLKVGYVIKKEGKIGDPKYKYMVIFERKHGGNNEKSSEVHT